MSMICREILNLPSLKDVKVVAGSNGMDRLVRWVYVAECFDDTREIVDWLYGEELVFITGRGLKGNSEALVDLIESIDKKNVAGIIINLGNYIFEIPEAAIELANNLALPVFTIPWETKLVEITRDICSTIVMKEMEEKSLDNILENIFFSELDLEENLIDRASYYGYDLKGNCYVCIIDIDHFSDFLKTHKISSEKAIIDIKVNFKRIIQEVLTRNNKKPLMMLRSDSVILLFKEYGNDYMDLEYIITKIREAIGKKLKGITISVGVGNIYSGLINMRKSLKEAEQALRIAKLSNSENSTYFYKNLGIYSLLLNIKEQSVLEKFYYDTLGKLVEYDKINSTELINTLEMYLKENGNITITSEKLYIHRNTLKYRICKIEEILYCDLRSLKDRMNLEIAFMIGNIIKNVQQ